MLMKCPNCNGEVYVTVITDDETGENFTSTYRCEKCKTILTEKKILEFNEEIFKPLK